MELESGDTKKTYIHADSQIMAQYDGDNVYKNLYIYGNYIDEVLFMANGVKWYDHDHLYSPVALVYYDGTVVERYEYDAYGNCDILEPNFADDPDGKSDYDNPYLFTGRRVDILDNGSLKLQYNRNRFYDQYTGRWLTHDPLGITPNAQKQNRFSPLDQYDDGMDLYVYVSNGPITLTDPNGLTAVSWIPVVGTCADFICPAPGISFGDYFDCKPDKCDWCGNDILDEAVKTKCVRCVDGKLLRYGARLMSATIVSDILDGALAKLFAPAWPIGTTCSVALVIDGVVHTILNVRQVMQMIEASRSAKIEYCSPPN